MGKGESIACNNFSFPGIVETTLSFAGWSSDARWQSLCNLGMLNDPLFSRDEKCM